MNNLLSCPHFDSYNWMCADCSNAAKNTEFTPPVPYQQRVKGKTPINFKSSEFNLDFE